VLHARLRSQPFVGFGTARGLSQLHLCLRHTEAAERAFAIAQGKISLEEGERADLIYSRISHPNAEILEDQMVPLETAAREAAVFNSGMAAIMTAFFTFAEPASSIVYTVPFYGGTNAPDPRISRTFRRHRHSGACGFHRSH